MRQDRWKEIEEARRLFSLPPEVTRREIREAYREKCREMHPDSNPESDRATDMARINRAYRILMDLADNYTIRLVRTEDGMTDEEWWMDHFGHDPLWTSGA